MKRCLALILLIGMAPGALAADGRALAERELEAKIQKQLEAIVGPGKARVTVSGEQSAGGQSRSRTQSKPQVAAEQRISETRTTTRNGETVTETRTDSRTSWTHDQSEELRSEMPSGLERKSVSVIYEPPARGEDGEEAAAPPVDQALIEDVVSAASGLGRDDTLDVHAVRMDTSAYDRLKEEMEKASRETPWWVFALIGAAGLGLGAGIGLLVARRRKPEPQAEWAAQPIWQGQPAPMPAQLPGQALSAPPQGPVVYLQPGSEKPTSV